MGFGTMERKLYVRYLFSIIISIESANMLSYNSTFRLN